MPLLGEAPQNLVGGPHAIDRRMQGLIILVAGLQIRSKLSIVGQLRVAELWTRY